MIATNLIHVTHDDVNQDAGRNFANDHGWGYHAVMLLLDAPAWSKSAFLIDLDYCLEVHPWTISWRRCPPIAW